MRMMLNDRCSTMPWDAIDNVVFDVGNVLLAFSPERILRRLLPDHETDYPALLDLVFRSPYWPMLDRGTLTGEEAVALMTCRRTDLRPLVQRIMSGWNECLDLIDEGVEALQACKARGKRCYALTNYADVPFAETCERYADVFSQLDGMVVSARLGYTKPDPRIYRRLLEEYRLNPERTLFIDDSAANIEGALDCGLQALWFDRPGQLSSFIR